MYKIEAKVENEDGVSSFTVYEKEERSTAFCTIEGPTHLQTRNEDFESMILDVKWRGEDLKLGKYYSKIIKSILEHFIILELDCSKYLCLSIYVTGSPRFSLLSSVNVALLGLINSGIPLKKMFYGVQNGDNLIVIDNKDVVFNHFISSNTTNIPMVPVELMEYTKEVINFSISQQHVI